MGISKYVAPHAMVAAAATDVRSPSSRLRLFFRGAGPFIDFLEQFVVLPNLGVVRFEREGLFVGLAGFVELSFVFVRDREVVVRRGISRVELDGFFPPVDGFAPQPSLS